MRTTTARRARALTTLLAAATMAFTLTGCNGYDSTSPAAARKHMAKSGPAAFATDAKGTVDCRKVKCIAITFDAGPSVRTPQILGILSKYHVHATFFTLGKNHVMKHPQMVRDMVAQGHEVETLTWSHQILTKISSSEVRKEITEGRDAVHKVAGVTPTLLRPRRAGPAARSPRSPRNSACRRWSGTPTERTTRPPTPS